jgi:hypothetical protein
MVYESWHRYDFSLVLEIDDLITFRHVISRDSHNALCSDNLTLPLAPCLGLGLGLVNILCDQLYQPT